MLQDSNFYNSTHTGSEDYLSKSFAGNMIRYAPNGQAPLFGLLATMGEAGKALAVEHGYFSKTMVFPSVELTAALTAGATTVTCADTSTIVSGEMLQVHSTGEIIRVANVVSATQLTVVRSVGQVLAQAAASGANLYSVGNAFEQGSNRPDSRLMNPQRVINHTQIFRNSWALPKTVSVIAPLVGDTLGAESKQDCALFHAGDIEKAMIFGQKSGQQIGNNYLTTMDGIIETVRRLAPAANTSVAGATTNYDQLEAMLDPGFDTINNGRMGNERVLLVGGGARTVINNIGRFSGQYQIVDGQTEFGLQFQTFKTSRGMFRMIEHPLFNANNDWKRLAISLDLGSIKPMDLRPTVNEEYGANGQQLADNGQDACGGTLTTELTAEITNPSANVVIHGLTAAAQ